MIFDIFKKRNVEQLYTVDLHSHLIPGVDDGAKTKEEALFLIQSLGDAGIKKIITTPHIYHGIYENTEQDLQLKHRQLTQYLHEHHCKVEVRLAAEYFADEYFLKRVRNQENFLTFGTNYILIELPFSNMPYFTQELWFLLQSQRLTPVLAHPERYSYTAQNMTQICGWRDGGVKFQVNLGSLQGAYGPAAKKNAEWLIKQKKIDFVGSDLHHQIQLNTIKKSLKSRLFKKISTKSLLNLQL